MGYCRKMVFSHDFAAPVLGEYPHQILTLWPHDGQMFGPSFKTIFASRWKALWFAASVMLTAYCSIPDAEKPQADDAANQVQIDNVTKSLENSSANLWQLDQR